MKKLLLLGLMVLCSQFSFAQSDADKMTKEGISFIENMPKDLQNRQNDAIRKAMSEEDYSSLFEVRNSRNVKPEMPGGVIAKDVTKKYRLYIPETTDGSPLPLLIYLHGGGWCFGSINSCAAFCSNLTKEAKIAVLAVEYPLSPEHPYPAPLNECMKALHYAKDNAEELGIDPDKISMGGDSAGGNLALATAVTLSFLREQLDSNNVPQDLPELSSLILFYPVTKVWNDGSDSWEKYKTGYGLDGEIMETFNEAYLNGNDPQMPFISPFNASIEHLSALPPTLIINADHDILKDQGEDMFKRLKKAGVKVQREVFPGTTHLFITVPGQPTAFNRAIRLTKEFLTE